MLILKELRFKNIGRFVEEQSISFDKLGNLVQIDGQNHNTGGSSGSGKSTVFNGLDFLFGLNSTPNTVLQSRLTEETMAVEGDFDLDGQPLTISRGKKLKITLNGEVTTGSSKLTEEKLDQILAIPRHLFRPMLHKKQGEKGFFLSFTPKEINDFLTDCLGLGHFKKNIVDLDIKLLDLSKMIGQLTSTLEAAKSGLNASQNALLSLGLAPVKEVDQDIIKQLKAKAEASEEQLKRLLDIHLSNIAILEINRPKIRTTPFDSSIKEGYEKDILAIRDKAYGLLSKEKDRQGQVQLTVSNIKQQQITLKNVIQKGSESKNEAIKIALEIKKIRENSCPTCEQVWTTDSAKKKEEELIAKVNELKESILAGEKSTIQFDVLGEELEYNMSFIGPLVPEGIKELQQQELDLSCLIEGEKIKENNHINAQNHRNQEKQQEFTKQQLELNAKQALESEQLRGQANLDRRMFETSVMKLKSYEEARIRYENSANTLKAQEQTYKEQVDSISKQLLEVNKNSELIEELKRAIKSYLSCSFDEALETIGENATRLARNVPNLANATIELRGVRETKEGKVKEEVNAILHLDGDENIDIRSLCGGERSAIDLSVDLSVIELIEDKTNKGINVIILDEPFTGLDTACIEMALEVLKSSNKDKKIIVVDHNPVVKESISDRIIVVREKEISHIE